jgi:hypothetical protein
MANPSIVNVMQKVEEAHEIEVNSGSVLNTDTGPLHDDPR